MHARPGTPQGGGKGTGNPCQPDGESLPTNGSALPKRDVNLYVINPPQTFRAAAGCLPCPSGALALYGRG
ncbi:hypothetical protein GCM10010215_77020 [Streptomyces virginiae]|uniref:Uncharacterized protein n=1 Tax=Streptomyces virginiae TaxID=1961 RepID=A0ABQ3NUP0_STRVG|nr:hypothetical protein GCM10010215_77020 [Streptomyces virginiae]GHI16500.1 hypothetical protein Scinn_59630 [Streptomyces virginiae]